MTEELQIQDITEGNRRDMTENLKHQDRQNFAVTQKTMCRHVIGMEYLKIKKFEVKSKATVRSLTLDLCISSQLNIEIKHVFLCINICWTPRCC